MFCTITAGYFSWRYEMFNLCEVPDASIGLATFSYSALICLLRVWGQRVGVGSICALLKWQRHCKFRVVSSQNQCHKAEQMYQCLKPG